MRELANFVSITVSGLTRVVERLSRQGLVERVRAESDGRGQVAVLTPAGISVCSKHGRAIWPLSADTSWTISRDVDLVTFAEALAEIGSAEVGPPVRRITPQPGLCRSLRG